MGFLTRRLMPRSVRRAAHPVRTVKRAATPKAVKQMRRAAHPVSNAKYSIERSLATKPRRRKRRAPVKRSAPVKRHTAVKAARVSWRERRRVRLAAQRDAARAWLASREPR